MRGNPIHTFCQVLQGNTADQRSLDMFAAAQAGRSLGFGNLPAKRLNPGVPCDKAMARAIAVAW